MPNFVGMTMYPVPADPTRTLHAQGAFARRDGGRRRHPTPGNSTRIGAS